MDDATRRLKEDHCEPNGYAASVESFFDVFDAPREQVFGDLALGGGGENPLGRGNCGIGRGGSHVGERLRLGLGDFRFRHLGAARDELFHPGLGLGGKPLGLGLGAGDDGLGLAFGLAALALELGEQRLRLLAQPARLVELGLDARLAVIERVEELWCTPR